MAKRTPERGEQSTQTPAGVSRVTYDDRIESRHSRHIVTSALMNPVIVESIRSMRRLRFRYRGRIRVVEPQCYGVGTRGTELLRFHQLVGGDTPEALFDVAKITDMALLDEVFARPGPHYQKNDTAMSIIYCQL